MLLFAYLYIIVWLPLLTAQSPPEFSARALDSLLQDYAFKAFVRPRTGIPYDGNVPSNLSGIEVSALRLRSGSLRRRGVSSYKEFHIPIGIVEMPYVERLVLVYHNMANWSAIYYPLPGFTYLAPVLGLLAYNASNLAATNLPELDIRASKKPILVKFPKLGLAPTGSSPKCVRFGLDGSVEFDNVLNGNVCSSEKQGHFSIVVEVIAPSPAPSGGVGGGGVEGKYEAWIIVGCVVGGFVLMVLLVIFIVWGKKCRRRKRIEKMELAAEGGVPLSVTTVGSTKVPVASGTRTRPVLENEFVP